MITQAFRDQSLDDILATRSKAVVLASDTSGGALESLSSATFVASKEEDKIALDDPDFWSVTQRPFPNVSELQLWEDGVSTISRHRDAVAAAVRESTRLAREPRQRCRCRAGRRRWARMP